MKLIDSTETNSHKKYSSNSDVYKDMKTKMQNFWKIKFEPPPPPPKKQKNPKTETRSESL